GRRLMSPRLIYRQGSGKGYRGTQAGSNGYRFRWHVSAADDLYVRSELRVLHVPRLDWRRARRSIGFSADYSTPATLLRRLARHHWRGFPSESARKFAWLPAAAGWPDKSRPVQVARELCPQCGWVYRLTFCPAQSRLYFDLSSGKQ